MRAFLPILVAATSAKSKSSGGSSYIPLLFIGLIAIVYFVVIRPRTQKARQVAQTQKSLETGDEVVSIGGITGRVVGVYDDEVEVEVANGVTLTFLRRAVNPRNPVQPTRPGRGAGAGAAGGGFGGFFRPRTPPPTTDPYEATDDFEDHDPGAGSGPDGLDNGADNATGDDAGPASGTGAGPASSNGAGESPQAGDPSASRRRRDKRPGRGGGSAGSAGDR